MKRFSGLLLTFLTIAAGLLLPSGRARGADERLDSLGRLLEEYTRTLEAYGNAFKLQECETIIGSCRDSATRLYTARKLFRHYADSPLMGEEAVAVGLYDRWFAGEGALPFESEESGMEARLFVSSNRRSLIGMPAPSLVLENSEGEEVTLTGVSANGRLSVLYFYSPDCAVCKLYSKQLEVLLTSARDSLELVAVYTGRDREAWQQYIRERLSWGTGRVRITHLWDPDGSSGMEMAYGVLSTPRLFLTDRGGQIAGRRLEPASLQQLLDALYEEAHYPYGEQTDAFAELLPPERLTDEEVENLAGHIRQTALERGRPVLARQMYGDLLYYLSRQDSEEGVTACDAFIRRHILSGEMQWQGENDSLCVVHLAEFLLSLHGKAAVGTKLPAVYALVEECVPAARASKALRGKFRLDRLKKRCRLNRREMTLLFYDPSCTDCQEQIRRAKALAEKDATGPAVFLIDVSACRDRLRPAESRALMEAFDLSSLPYLIQCDARGVITRRYFKL